MHRTREDLEVGLAEVRDAPKDRGRLEMIVRRPEEDGREILDEVCLSFEEGVDGDDWRTYDVDAEHPADPDEQIAIISARVAALVAGSKERWALAGDQLYLDLDLSVDNLPPGTRLAVGSAVIEVTAAPHTGCSKFAARYGMDAARFVNSPVGRQLNLRGIHARVVQPGTVRCGDLVEKVGLQEVRAS